MWRIDVLRQVPQLEWVIAGGKGDVFTFAARFELLKFSWCVFPGKTSLNEVLECGCLSHATIAEFLEPSSWVVMMYA